MNLPMSYRGIIRLAKKLGITLKPNAIMTDYFDNKEGCILTVLAVANHLNWTFELREMFPNNAKLAALENGFEGKREFYDFMTYDPSVEYTKEYRRYYKIGQQLRSYALGAPQA